MIRIKTIIIPHNIIFDEDCGQKFEWNLYQNNNLSIKLCRDETRVIIIEEKKLQQDVEQVDIDPQYRLSFEKVMALLRIYKKGNVHADSFQVIIDDIPLEPRGFPYMIPWGPALFSFYILKASDEAPLKELFNYFKDLDIENTSLHWFTYAPFRPLIRDRLVDYVIALESIFIEYTLNGGRRGPPKKEALKSRGVNIFGSLDYGSDNRPNITDWNSFVDDFYDYRSRIVHGAKKDDQPPLEDVLKIVTNLETVCRGFLKKFLKDGTLYDWNLRKNTYEWST
jgi:hypothetical protein